MEKKSNPSKSAESLYDEGIDYLKSNEFSKAKERFEKAIALKPSYPKAWFQLGYVNGTLYNKDRAIECYKKAIELDPKDEEAWYNLGNEYLHYGRVEPLVGDPYEEEWGKPEEAINCYEKAVEIDPNFGFAWNNMGYAHFQLKNYQKAVEYHQKAVDLDPKNDSALINLGNAYYFVGNYEKPVEIYEKAIELFPENNMAWVVLRAAVETYIMKVELNHQNKEMWVKVGKNFLKLGQQQKGIDCFKKVIKLDNKNYDAWHELGYFYNFLKDHQKYMVLFPKLSTILNDLRKVSIVTTSKGPMYPDVFWLLENSSEISIVPSEGPDENFLSQVQPIPGFKNEEVIRAMKSTEDNIFVCWEKS